MINNKKYLILTAGVALLCTYPSLATTQHCNPPPSSQAFIDHHNGTVTDQRTQLMWKTCLEGQLPPSCSGKPKALQWHAALELTQEVVPYRFAGYRDWRLPTRAELETLIESNCREPATNTQVFPSMTTVGLWSSDIADQAKHTAWGVDFTSGRSFEHFQTASKYVRLVRNAR